MAQLIGYLTGEGFLTGSLSGTGELVGGLTVPEVITPETYFGPYEFAPSDEEQIIEIERMVATGNITIGAVPTDYGRLAYNGTTLRIY